LFQLSAALLATRLVDVLSTQCLAICWDSRQFIKKQHTAQKNSCRSPRKILTFPVLSSHYYFGDSIWLLIWWIQTFFFGIPYITLTIPTEQSNILKHILEKVILKEPGSCLEIALQLHGCQSILDVMALTPWEIETLQWTDGSKPKDNSGRGYRTNVISLQDFVLSLHPSPISMTTNNWIALTSNQ
jgi:hypothetical protein